MSKPLDELRRMVDKIPIGGIILKATPYNHNEPTVSVTTKINASPLDNADVYTISSNANHILSLVDSLFLPFGTAKNNSEYNGSIFFMSRFFDYDYENGYTRCSVTYKVQSKGGVNPLDEEEDLFRTKAKLTVLMECCHDASTCDCASSEMSIKYDSEVSIRNGRIHITNGTSNTLKQPCDYSFNNTERDEVMEIAKKLIERTICHRTITLRKEDLNDAGYIRYEIAKDIVDMRIPITFVDFDESFVKVPKAFYDSFAKEARSIITNMPIVSKQNSVEVSHIFFVY